LGLHNIITLSKSIANYPLSFFIYEYITFSQLELNESAESAEKLSKYCRYFIFFISTFLYTFYFAAGNGDLVFFLFCISCVYACGGVVAYDSADCIDNYLCILMYTLLHRHRTLDIRSYFFILKHWKPALSWNSTFFPLSIFLIHSFCNIFFLIPSSSHFVLIFFMLARWLCCIFCGLVKLANNKAKYRIQNPIRMKSLYKEIMYIVLWESFAFYLFWWW